MTGVIIIPSNYGQSCFRRKVSLICQDTSVVFNLQTHSHTVASELGCLCHRMVAEGSTYMYCLMPNINKLCQEHEFLFEILCVIVMKLQTHIL